METEILQEILAELKSLNQGQVKLEQGQINLEQAQKNTVNGVAQMIEESETRLTIFIENNVTKRIDSLFDGYKLNHEKQWELEHRTETMQNQINELQARLAAIENRIA